MSVFGDAQVRVRARLQSVWWAALWPTRVELRFWCKDNGEPSAMTTGMSWTPRSSAGSWVFLPTVLSHFSLLTLERYTIHNLCTQQPLHLLTCIIQSDLIIFLHLTKLFFGTRKKIFSLECQNFDAWFKIL